jgi:hypothetical protein
MYLAFSHTFLYLVKWNTFNKAQLQTIQTIEFILHYKVAFIKIYMGYQHKIIKNIYLSL